MIYIASDHRGFELKNLVSESLRNDEKFPMTDVGPAEYDSSDDYIDYAEKVVELVLQDPAGNRGILICGSGHGMDITANKHKGIRAALALNSSVARQSREHENTNVLVLASDWLKPDEALEVVKAWLETDYSAEERHQRRLDKLQEIEGKNFK